LSAADVLSQLRWQIVSHLQGANKTHVAKGVVCMYVGQHALSATNTVLHCVSKSAHL